MAEISIKLGGSYLKDGNICRFFTCSAINGNPEFKDSGLHNGFTFTVSKTKDTVTITSKPFGHSVAVTIPRNNKNCYYCFQPGYDPGKGVIESLIEAALR